MADIITDLDDLIVQATTENSHFYTAGVLRRAKAEIEGQRAAIKNLLDAVAVRNESLLEFENGRMRR